MSTADVLAELAYLNPRNKRKGKGGRQPAMDPRLDPTVDPKKAKRILANRLSAARSKMKQKSHVEVCHLNSQISPLCSLMLFFSVSTVSTVSTACPCIWHRSAKYKPSKLLASLPTTLLAHVPLGPRAFQVAPVYAMWTSHWSDDAD